MDQRTLDRIIAAIDSRETSRLPVTPHMPEGAQGCVILAARAANHVREAAADAIAAACEWDLAVALRLAVEAERNAGAMRKRLQSALNICSGVES